MLSEFTEMSKKLTKIFEAIEDPRFDAECNTTSELFLFVDIVYKSREFRDLLDYVDNPSYEQEVVQHILKLLASTFDKQYHHPHDTAIASYLLWLKDMNLDHTRLIVNTILVFRKLGDHMFWTRRVINLIAEEQVEYWSKLS
jgi:hypothetical protein